ncbi:MAG: flagellar biosynthesis protein FlhF [Planctomyces sp.]|nr:flagellar biosynthesis protein FlhF [Planctomyces sp.]
MQQIKTFRAGSMQEALDLVRSEVGPDAIILHTKQIDDRSRLPWKKSKSIVEVTIALEEEPGSSRLSQSIANRYRGESAPDLEEESYEEDRPGRPTAASNKSLALQLLSQIGKDEDELELSSLDPGKSRLSAQPARPTSFPTERPGSLPEECPQHGDLLNRPLTAAQQREYRSEESAEEQPDAPRRPAPFTPASPTRERQIDPAPVATRTNGRPQSIAAMSLNPKPAPSSATLEAKPAKAEMPAAKAPEAKRNTIAQSHPRHEAQPPVRQAAVKPTTRTAPSTTKSYVDADFANRLANIERMLMNLGRHNPMLAMHELPNSLFNLYTKLIDVDVAEEVARELVFDIKKQCRPQELEIEGRTDAVLEGLIEKQFHCAGPIQVAKGRRKVVALVGATGVGKTTTIAKLAANFKLRQGLKMGLVTVDTYRIAAVEQLRTYAEIMDLPVKVVTDVKEMRQALDELQGLDLVLIDTGGRSPKDEPKLQELKALLQEARADEVHLVLNLTASLRSLETMTQEFAAAGTTSLILTKLDETEGLGPMLNLARKVSLPVSYLTTGQTVPEDIEAATAPRMRRLLLGQELIGQPA